ncbi:hypothetical protein [Mycolicibacterium sp. S2-37]|uniref:hypothetical protein n=1 Tax=Mycolicibacterium sp. S2-37 TaxID=2810297 RepID=UPI001F5F3AD8|nr:hypothetical protein [Mycolicibacterium sp. S2-37]
MESLSALRDEYRTVHDHIKTLAAEIRAGNGPATRAAAGDLLRMRRQVDADRPHSHAVTAVMEQWADADAAYNDTLRLVEHSRIQLDLLLATPDADELDIITARQTVAFYTGLPPAQPPSLQFQQALADAHAARAAAAGGTIVTENDIAIARGDAERADLAEVAALRQRRRELHRDIERAGRDIATAFAAAQSATSDTLEQLLESARVEVELLKVAGHLNPKSVPLLIPGSALSGLEPQTGDRLKSLAASPYRLAVIGADIEDSETAAALYTLRSAANADDRKVLWLAASESSSAPARDAELADTITTIGHAHQQVSEQQWMLPPGAIVVIDDPATAEPDQLIDLARHAVAADARGILIDDGTGAGASSSAVQLLAHSLPWNNTLTTAPSEPTDPLSTSVPAVTLADRLGRKHLSEPWLQLLAQYDAAASAVRSAQRRQLALGWRAREMVGRDHGREAGTGIDQ